MKKSFIAVLCVLGLMLGSNGSSVFAAASVTTATGGSAISADKARIGGTGTFTALTGPALAETDTTGMPLGSMILNAPAGFEFDTTANSVTVTVTGIGVGTDLLINTNNSTATDGSIKTITPTASAITVWVTATSINSARSTCTWSGIKVRPINGTPVGSSNITYSGTSSGVTSGTNLGTLTEVAGAANKLAYTTAPAATNTAGATMTSIVVQVRDQFGNNVSSNNIPISVALNTGAFASGATNVNTTATGVATFSNLIINTAGGNALTASAPTTSLTSTSPALFTVVPAAASTVTFAQRPPSSVSAGTTFSPAVMVKVTDAFGNAISNKAVAISLNGGGTLNGTLSQATAASGVATYSNLSVNTIAGTNYTLTASITSPSLSVTSTPPFAVTAGVATKLVMKTEPSATATAGAAFSTQPAVYVEDVNGNIVTTDGSTVTAALVTGTGPLQGVTATAVDGVATFANLADNKAESIKFQFTDGSLATVTSATTIVVSPGTTTHYAVTAASPQDAGIPFFTTVTAQDSFGNTVNDSSTIVTLGGSSGSVQFDGNGDGVFGDNTRKLTNGSLTIRTKDNLAETVTLTATDGTRSGTSANVVVNSFGKDWKYRKAITIDHTRIPNTDQTNFPVLISVIDSNLAAHAQSSGNDILFVASDGATVLSYEKEAYTNTTGTLAAWVKIPSLSHTTNTVIYMYYGNPNSGDQQDAANVWNADYKLVYHLNDAGPNVKDSTTNANNGAQSGGVTFGATGEIGGATTYANGNTSPTQSVVATAQPLGTSYTGSFTYHVWIKVSSFTGGADTTDANHMSYFVDRVSGGGLASLVAVGSGFGYETRYDDGTGLGGPAGGTIPAGTVWTHIEMVRDFNTAFRLYVNGTQVSTTPDSGSKSLTPGIPKLGRHATFGTPAYLNGSLDEFRISDVARSADWIQTEYNNESSPATFYTVGGEQMVTFTSVSSSLNPSTYGQSITFTATVTATNLPVGTVQFQTDGVNAGGAVALSGGIAHSFALSTLVAGTNAITAIYIPSGNFTASTGTLTGGQVVNAALLSITANADSKTYGQTKTYGANSTAFTTVGLQNGDSIGSVTINASGGSASNAAVGSYSLTPSTPVGAVFSPSNYTITYNSGSLTVSPSVVTLAGSRSYDGTATAAAGILTVSNRLGSDDVTVASGSGALANANVGAPAITSPGSLVLGGSTAGNYTLTGASGSVNIGPAALTITASTNTKTYDGTAVAAAAPAVTGLQGSDSVSGLAEAYATKAVGTGKTLAITSYTVNDGNGGNNYSVVLQNNTSGVINTRSLTVSAHGANKVYDGNTTATITLGDDRIAGDDLTTSYATALFADKNIGVAKSISVTGIALGGTDAGNYAANGSAITSADITPAPVTGSITASDKVYDGTTTATISGYGLSGAISGDNVNLSGGSANFFDKNVGNAKAVTANGLVLGGTDAGNYALGSDTANTTASITSASLNVSADNKNRPYAQVNPSLTASYAGFASGDDATVLVGSPDLSTAALTNSPVGSYPITVQAGSLSADNYTFNFVDGTLTIGKALLTVTADDQSRSYGATNPVLTVTVVGFVDGDDTNALSGLPDVATAADTNSTVAGSPYPITVTSGTLIATNYNFAFVSGTLTVTPAIVTVTADNQAKVYGDPVPVLTASYSGFVNGEDTNVLSGMPDLSTDATATSPVVGSSYTIVATNGTLAADNYTFAFVNGIMAVTPAPLTGSITASDKVYDGMTAATISGYSLAGVIGADDVNLSGGSANFDDKNVGASKSVTALGLALGGTDAGNYSLVSDTASATASITVRSLTVAANGMDKVYDGSATAAVTLLDDRISGDSLIVSYTAALFGDKNVGTAKPVNVSGIALGGADAGNYAANTSASTAASITAAPVSGSITASDKVYDGTTTATIASYGLAGTIGSDDVSLSGGSANFADKNVGPGKSVTANGLTLIGADAGNYALASGSANALANITTATLTVRADDKNRPYAQLNPSLTASYTGFVAGDDTNVLSGMPDLSTAALTNSPVGPYPITVAPGSLSADNYTFALVDGTLTIGRALLTVTADDQSRPYGSVNPALTVSYAGFVDGDDTNVLSGLAEVTTAADTNSTVAAGPYTITVTNGTLVATNYDFAFVSGALTVTPAVVTVTADNQTKVYGDPVPTLTASYSGFVNGEDTNVLSGTPDLSTDASATSPVVGSPYTIVVTNGTLAADNYTFSFTDGTLTITSASLTGSITANDKVYDGTTTATIGSYSLIGVIGSDNVTLGGGSANFDNKNVGTAKSVSATGLALGGVDAGNYTLASSSASTAANITTAPVTGSITANDKAYDGTTTATISGYGLAGTIGAEDVSLGGGSASFVDKNVGNGKSVTASGLTLGGADAGNYALVSDTAATTASITAVPLAVFADNKSKTTGVSNPTLTATYVGFVNGEDTNALTTAVSLSTTADDSSPVGTYPITASSGAAQNYTLGYNDGTMTVEVMPLLNIVRSGSQVTVTCPATISTQAYQFEYKDDLRDATWTVLGSATPGTGSSVTITNTMTGQNRFFRVQIMPGE